MCKYILIVLLAYATQAIAKNDVVSEVKIPHSNWCLLTFNNGDQKKVHNLVWNVNHHGSFYDHEYYYKFANQPWQWVTYTWYWEAGAMSSESEIEKDLFDWHSRDTTYTIDDKYPNIYYVLKVDKVNYFCKTFTRNQDGTTCFTTCLYSHNTYENIKIDLVKDMQVVDIHKTKFK